VVLAVAAILIAPLRDAPNHGKAALRSAGDWLRANSLPQDVIAADSKLSPLGFYSDRRMAWPEEGTADERWAKLSGERPQWYCDDPKRSYAEGAEQGLLERCRRAYAIGTPAFEAGGATETTIRMYRTGGR
jgi:diadenosine tetraphosphatase ApaH/serine/threonine PP2A family protein phosphatase